jgi:hypothetical protein
MSRLATTVLHWYARHVPYHRGKTRISRYLRTAFGVRLDGESVERRDGLMWCFDRTDYMSQDLYWSGSYDRAELRQALRAMPAGGVMLDIGANFGFFATGGSRALARDRLSKLRHPVEPGTSPSWHTVGGRHEHERAVLARRATAHLTSIRTMSADRPLYRVSDTRDRT